MAEYRLSERARRDLEDIRLYTLENWGNDRAKQYLIELALKFEQIAAAPGLGRVRGEIDGSVRSFSATHHTVFYRECVDGIEVVRVLHPSMDDDRNFDR